ncbi:MAG: glutamate-1-semialdehyde 2,1-aminomutase [Planctomycetaceae bacterium]|nr:glutamate-1-semialdehyde 2,1-aminomutase [Planctomycetaceae bacterium]
MTNSESRKSSRVAYERAKQVTPGGVNSAARAFGAVGGHPIFIKHAEGAWLTDIDGNRYIDYIGSWGPMILGHQHPQVKHAIQAALEHGTSYGAPTEAETRLAELIIEAVPSVEMVRLVSSGTEATLSTIRLARGATGRDKIVKFAGNYHGHVDSLLVAAGSAAATLAVPNSPGVTKGTSQDTIVLEYNSVASLQATFEEYPNEIAAVILEPVCGNMGCVTPSAEFLQSLRALTEKYGALLVFDEVMCGFRVDQGGAQKLFGIAPDLTVMGKIVGGGLPLAAFGGKQHIMKHVLPAGRVFQAGTLSGNPLATAAGIATLEALRDPEVYKFLELQSAKLAVGLAQSARKHGVPHQLNRVGSMMTLFFHDQPITNWATASRCDTARFAKFFWGLMDRGVYWPCSQFEALFVSLAHTDDLIAQTIAAADEALSQL